MVSPTPTIMIISGKCAKGCKETSVLWHPSCFALHESVLKRIHVAARVKQHL